MAGNREIDNVVKCEQLQRSILTTNQNINLSRYLRGNRVPNNLPRVGITCDAPLRAVHAALRVEHMHIAEVEASWIGLRPVPNTGSKHNARPRHPHRILKACTPGEFIVMIIRPRPSRLRGGHICGHWCFVSIETVSANRSTRV